MQLAEIQLKIQSGGMVSIDPVLPSTKLNCCSFCITVGNDSLGEILLASLSYTYACVFRPPDQSSILLTAPVSATVTICSHIHLDLSPPYYLLSLLFWITQLVLSNAPLCVEASPSVQLLSTLLAILSFATPGRDVHHVLLGEKEVSIFALVSSRCLSLQYLLTMIAESHRAPGRAKKESY